MTVEKICDYSSASSRCVPSGRIVLRWGGVGMKVHAYRVVPRGEITLDAVLTHIAALPLADRLKAVSGAGLRLEHAHKQGAYWLADFTLVRREGPGRVSPDAPIQDFDLQDAEGFGQETAAYFDTATNFMTLQYNHYGPRVARIQAYLSRFARTIAGHPDDEYVLEGVQEEGFNLTTVLKAEAATRIDEMGIVKNIEFSFYVPGVAAREAGQRQSLSSFLESPLVGGAETVRIQINASRKKKSSLVLNDVKSAISDLLGIKEDVSELSIVAKETEDGPSEPVDFLDARLEADIPVPVGANRRYPRDNRINALVQAFNVWRGNGLLV